MAGLIQSAQQAPEDNAPEQSGAPGQSGLVLTPDAVEKHANIPPELQKQYKALIVAGKTIMYSPQTHDLMQQTLSGPDPMAKKLAMGITGLMVLIWNESKGSVNPKLVIPVATALMAEAVDYIEKTGMAQITNQDVSQALTLMIPMIVKKIGGAGQNGATPAPNGATPAPSTPMAQPAPGGQNGAA